MHYGIIAIGSRGDVQPFVALALGLLDHGHAVTLLAHENFKTFVEGYGIPFHALPGSVEAMLYTPQGLKLLQQDNMLAFMRFVAKVVAKNQPDINRELLAGTQAADVLITSLVSMIWAEAIAAKTGKPWAAIQPSFPSTPTRAFPFALLSFFDFPAYNRFTYKLFDYIYNRDYKKQLNEFRRQLGLTPVSGSILKNIAAANAPNLHAISPSLLPRPADWPPNDKTTGFLYLHPKRRKEHPQDRFSPELTRWLAAGEAPVYIGFGSIPVPDPKKFEQMIRQLLQQTQYRFIFCQGWSHLAGLPRDNKLCVVETADHDLLFPQCRIGIVHGGVGTIAAALRAKLPLVIASIFADQPWWGGLIARRGLGTHLPFRRWTTPRLINAIRITDDPEVHQRVDALGDKIRSEDGLAAAIAALETYFEQPRHAAAPAALTPVRPTTP